VISFGAEERRMGEGAGCSSERREKRLGRRWIHVAGSSNADHSRGARVALWRNMSAFESFKE
jgi:hypothetical protein